MSTRELDRSSTMSSLKMRKRGLVHIFIIIYLSRGDGLTIREVKCGKTDKGRDERD